MIEALVAFAVAVLVLVVFNGPAWAIKLGGFGGLAFVFYIAILVAEWLVAKIPRAPAPPPPH